MEYYSYAGVVTRGRIAAELVKSTVTTEIQNVMKITPQLSLTVEEETLRPCRIMTCVLTSPNFHQSKLSQHAPQHICISSTPLGEQASTLQLTRLKTHTPLKAHKRVF